MDLISKTHMVCNGCTREGVIWNATGYVCPVYSDPSKISMVKLGECSFNKKVRKVKAEKVVNALKASKRNASGG